MVNLKSRIDSLYYSIISFVEKYYFIFFTLIMLVIGYICFKNLGAFPVQDWDEARHGVSAYEMFKNNEYIVNTYNYSNDYWNLKPPMSFWAIIMFFKIFGVSVFSMRLYSAISMFLTILIVGIFIVKRYGKLEGLLALVIFSTASPLYLSHMGRSGDADSIYVLFFTLAMLFMIYIGEKSKALYFSGLFFALAFLTKSWHAFSIVAVGGLFLLFTGEIKKMKLKQWILFIASFIVPILLWIFARIYKDGTHFLTEMIRYDLLERSKNPLEGHVGPITFYFDYMISNNTELILLILLVIMLTIILFYKNSKIKKHDLIAFVLWGVIPFALFTYAKTKIAWYIIPVYVPLFIIASIAIGKLLKEKKFPLIFKLVIIVLFLGFSARDTKNNISVVRHPNTDVVQNFISNNLVKHKEIYNTKAYIEIEDDKWSQSRLFVGEISADLKCEQGGIKEFIKEKDKSILIISESKYKDNEENLKDLKKLESDNGLYLLQKEL